VVARVAVALGFLVAHGAVDALRPGAPPLPLEQGLVAWDGAFYRDIATLGYDGVREEALRFFPLFPLLGRVVGAVLPGGATTGLVVVANVSAVVAGVLLHRLVVHDGGGSERATTAVWLVALLPASAVLALAYTEALFLALTIGAFLAMRRGRWSVVVALALLSGAVPAERRGGGPAHRHRGGPGAARGAVAGVGGQGRRRGRRPGRHRPVPGVGRRALR
jgi:hypothetical protein